jgi:spore maturation protein SpmB
MIPISIAVRLIQEWGLLTYFSQFLSPIMSVADLPAEMGLVWLTSMVVNIYGGLLTFFSIYPALGEPMTVAQMTTLLTMILVAHTFPIELTISQKTGVKTWIMFLIRFGFAILLGFLMAKMYSAFHYLQEPTQITPIFSTTQKTWGAWALNELKNYAIITLIIFTLVTVLRLLQVTGLIKIINKTMQPALKWLGIGSEMLPLTIIGLTMGIAYGGGLMIEECRNNSNALKPKEIFYSMTLMGLFHSIIEDTLLMLSMGGHWSGVVVFRAVFAFVITYLIVRFTRNVDEKHFLKYVMTKAYGRRYLSSTQCPFPPPQSR